MTRGWIIIKQLSGYRVRIVEQFTGTRILSKSVYPLPVSTEIKLDTEKQFDNAKLHHALFDKQETVFTCDCSLSIVGYVLTISWK